MADQFKPVKGLISPGPCDFVARHGQRFTELKSHGHHLKSSDAILTKHNDGKE
ncbi:hypothetical protein BS47DRAFT_1354714 [Hydnum rufescens UP504]|uniref:Uncharacterized protein n=1 Tax=Hydnum rufescens UP504 TaxID=1448309 RepID=A0A9P6DHM2_9AGAM|nr:hypothetical protein BS47DRAFT_1354714 [Hydnum rufescens UP504]